MENRLRAGIQQSDGAGNKGFSSTSFSYSQVLGCNAREVKSGAAPSLWTDGLVRNDKLIWSTNGEEVDFNPEQVEYWSMKPII